MTLEPTSPRQERMHISQPRTVPWLAPELQDRILDHLHASVRDLTRCSLVCKAWLPSCRYHLFSEVVYRPGLSNLLVSSVRSPSPIPCHIKKLLFVGPLQQTRGTDNRPGNTGRVGTTTGGTQDLRKLQEVHLTKSSWTALEQGIPAPLASTLSRAFSQVTRLNLRHIRFETVTRSFDVFNSFYVLQELYLENISWDAFDADAASENGLLLRKPVIFAKTLKRLAVVFCHNRIILNWLLSGLVTETDMDHPVNLIHEFPSLVFLSFSDVLPAEASLLGHFVSNLSSTLEHLGIGFVHQDNAFANNEINRSIDLSGHVALKAISVHGINLFQFPSFLRDVPVSVTPGSPPSNSTSASPRPPCTFPYNWVTPWLAAVPVGILQELTLHIWASTEEQVDRLDWPRFLAHLADPSTRVPSFVIKLSGCRQPHLRVRLKRYLKSHLRKLDVACTRVRVVSDGDEAKDGMDTLFAF